VGDERKLGRVERREHALIFGFLHLGVGHVTDQREIERAVLRGYAACEDRQHESSSSRPHRTPPHGRPPGLKHNDGDQQTGTG
jgi:hypothetical protein